jgi:hypothetical protein
MNPTIDKPASSIVTADTAFIYKQLFEVYSSKTSPVKKKKKKQAGPKVPWVDRLYY